MFIVNVEKDFGFSYKNNQNIKTHFLMETCYDSRLQGGGRREGGVTGMAWRFLKVLFQRQSHLESTLNAIHVVPLAAMSIDISRPCRFVQRAAAAAPVVPVEGRGGLEEGDRPQIALPRVG